MKELLFSIIKSEQEELKRASKKFGPHNNSHHESYAVILEEKQEAEESAFEFEKAFEQYWDDVRHDQVNPDVLAVMETAALRAAAEWVQVAAMCAKAQRKKNTVDTGAYPPPPPMPAMYANERAPEITAGLRRVSETNSLSYGDRQILREAMSYITQRSGL